MDAIIFHEIAPIFEESDDLGILSDKGNSESNFQPPKKIGRQIMCTSKWTVEENEIYLEFILQHREELENQNARRKAKVFKMLSDQMQGAKTSEQCRGHHKKFIESYKTIDQIAEALRQKKMKKELKQLKSKNKRKYTKGQKSEKKEEITPFDVEEKSLPEFFEESSQKLSESWGFLTL